MNPLFRKAALIAASFGLLISLYLALSPDDGDEAAPPTTTLATTTEGTTSGEPPATTTEPPATTAPPGPVRFSIVAGGEIERGRVKEGREVVIVVRADVADRVHLHGYDLMIDVAPGKRARIEFTATIPGAFQIELEDRHQLIGVLEVGP